MNTMLQEILDFPPIAQGVIGSFLFLVLYQLLKWFSSLVWNVVGHFSANLKKELLLAKLLFHAHSIAPEDTSRLNNSYLKSIYLAVNRTVHAGIFAIFGLASEPILGDISIVAYVIALGYLFLALRAVRLDFGPELPEEAHLKEMVRLGESYKHEEPTNAAETDKSNG